MGTILGTLNRGTADEVTYELDEFDTIHECRPNSGKLFFCTHANWPGTLSYAALKAQEQHITILDYLLQQRPVLKYADEG